MKTRILNQLLATTVFCGAALTSAPAFAQDTTEPTAEAPTTPVEATDPSVSAQGTPIDESTDIVVTGSRIPQPNLTSVSPVTVVNSQEIRLQGTTRTEDLINSLPQSFAGQGGNLANGATGTATVNLRGLGPQRTLVLVNGRRLVPGDPNTLVVAPDINFIPAGDRRAGRRADRRRLVGLRLGRRRRRRQLHHGHRLRGHPPRCPVQLLPARQQLEHAASSRRFRAAASRSRRGSVADGGTSISTPRSASASTTAAATSSPMPATASSIR